MTRKLVSHLVVEAVVPTRLIDPFRCLTQAALQLFLSTPVTKHGRAFDAVIARSNVSPCEPKSSQHAFIYL